MSTFTKVAMGVIAIAFVTTLILPGRQTPAVLGGFTRLATGTLSTATGQTSGPQG